MNQIFISYQSSDIMLAQKMRNMLEVNGYKTWFAPANIPITGDFTKEIATNLEDASMVILLLSKYSMQSNWVSDEIAMAKSENKPILAVRVDHEPMTPQFRFMLQRIQILDGYQLENNTLNLVLSEVQKHVKKKIRIKSNQQRFSEQEIKVSKICGGDPYYEEGTTLFVKLSKNSFYLAPPPEVLENADDELTEWIVDNGFSKKDVFFGEEPESFLLNFPLTDLKCRIDESRRRIFSQFRNKENGCYFNNKKYGVEDINPFGRSRDEREQPKLELKMYETDYFTHRVMKDVCKTLALEKNTYLEQINYTHIGVNKVFFTSFGINLIVAENSLMDNFGLLITSRSMNSAETYGTQLFSLSVIEGVSCSDYDTYQDKIRLSLAVERGLLEELNVTENILQKGSLCFYDLFINHNNLEMGIFCTIELKKEVSIDTHLLNLHGKDEELEISDKRKVGVTELENFIQNNQNMILPQALYCLCAFLEKNGVMMFDRYNKKAHKKETFIYSKKGMGYPCGDRLVDSEHFLAVIDGATPKGSFLWNGQRGDVFVSEVLEQAILELDPMIDGRSAIEEINNRVREQYVLHGLNFETLKPEEQLQASVLIYSKARREIWGFGDCMLRINHNNYRNVKKGDLMLSDLRAFCIEAAEIQGVEINNEGNDFGREQILAFLKQYTLFANSDKSFGYDVINGGKIYSERVKIYAVQSGDNVVMASDGYPKLFDTLKETEAYLAKALEDDPQCIGILRGTKGIQKGDASYDDRSYISFTVH